MTAPSADRGLSSEALSRKPLRLVFMGTPQFAVPSLDRLAAGPDEVVAVVTQPDRPAGRGQKLRESAVKVLAKARGLPVLQPTSARSGELADSLRSLAPDIAVVVAYGRILPADVISIPRLGCINAHASLLPHLRGAAPIQRALMAGDSTTGVTIMRINEQMDAGDVLLTRVVPIATGDDAASLAEKLSHAAADLLADALERLAAGPVVETAQDPTAATYAPPISRDEGALDWSLPAEQLERQVRAFRPEPGAFTFHDGLRIKVLRAVVVAAPCEAAPGSIAVRSDGAVCVACGLGALLLEEVRPEGGRAMSATDYFRGKGAARGSRLGAVRADA
jgi:methionyl-tRNA formyltransferase